MNEKRERILRLLATTRLDSRQIAERVGATQVYVLRVAREHKFSFRHRDDEVKAPSAATCMCPIEFCAALPTCRMRREPTKQREPDEYEF